jgi:subtilisin-like proprotein convertase family protein
MNAARRARAALIVVLVALPASPVAARSRYAPTPTDRRKIRLSDAAAVREVTTAGGQLLADYGAFAVIEVNRAAARELADARAAESIEDQNRILLNAETVDTRRPAAPARRAVPAAFTGRRLHLIQWVGPVKPEWLDALEKTGVRVVDYIPFNTYLVAGTPAALKALRDLAAASKFIQWEGAYLPADRIQPSARAARLASATGSEDYVLQLVLDPEANADTVKQIEAFRLGPIRKDEVVLQYRNLVTRLPNSALAALSERPDVLSIDRYVTPVKHDERQDQIVAGNLSGAGPAGPGYLAWLYGKGFTQDQFTASGFAVDVTDSGIDNGTTNPNHFALHVLGSTSSAGRVVYNRLEGTPNAGSTIQACDGHGNINAHIISGYVDFGAWPHADGLGYRYGLGVCPFVRVGSSVIFDPDTFTSPVYADLMSRAYRDGARVSANSWGANVAGAYNTDSQAYDALVRDAQPAGSAVASNGNQEITIVFSAGNAGYGAQTVGSPGTAKNVITVGAAENVHSHSTANGGNDASGNDGCGIADSGADSAEDIISFSSRGPCADQRAKPDLVGPGTHVTGGAPQDVLDSTGTGNDLACFAGTGVCRLPGGGTAGDPDNFFPTNQQFYTTSSGTSHSCPAVAGGCALIRQYFINRGWAVPSPALLKAYLLNACRYLTGADANDTLWSNNQGWGEMNLGVAFDGVARVLREQDTNGLFTASGQSRTISCSVADPSKPVRVTLAWTDAPGSTTGDAFRNDLDLVVQRGATTYRGNVFSGAYSTTGGAADPRNNVESVFLPAATTGAFSVVVSAAGLNSDGVPNVGGALDQDFALVIYNAIETPLALIVSAGSILAAEGCAPGNGVADPGEPVTVWLGLRNIGTADATNVVARLLAQGGVAGPSTDQVYAVLSTNGVAVSNAYSFTAYGPCSGTVTATLELAQSSNVIGYAAFAFPLGVTTVLTSAYENTAAITINDNASASPYPSTINVAGFTGTVGEVQVLLRGVQHTWPADVDVLLVGPQGQRVVLMAACGGGADVGGADLTFDDDAPPLGSGAISSGAYAPTALVTPTFASPAPAGPYGSELATFNGVAPNGAWSLYVQDHADFDVGAITQGWRIVFMDPSTLCCGGAPLMAAAGSALLYEGCAPSNGRLDPGETVTVSFGIRNSGAGPTSNLVVTLLAGDGVTGPGGPVTNGMLPAGASVSNAFTFTATGACGGQVTATLQLQDGALDLGQLDYPFALGQGQTVTNVFSNPAYIAIRDAASALPYPSTIAVSGQDGPVVAVFVGIYGLGHTYPDDVDLLLVGPLGQKVMLMSDAGGSAGITGVNLLFDDRSGVPVPDSSPLVSGTYHPANYETSSDSFPAPAPASPYGTNLAVFATGSVNGIWSLYLVDDVGADTGYVASGWTLGIVTTAQNCCTGGADSDGDGMDDAWEVVNFGNLTVAGTNTDYDGDAFSDVSEFIAGTEATNSQSVFLISSYEAQPPQGNVIRWSSISSRSYAVYFASSLDGLAFGALTSGLPATPPLNTFTDVLHVVETDAYYRVSVKP